MLIVPEVIYTFNAIPVKITPAFFIEQLLNSQSNIEKEKQSWSHHNSGLQVVLQSCNHQDSMVLAQKQTDQWNRTENPEIDPQMYGQLIFDKAGKIIQWEKDSLFNNWCWENWTATCRRMKLDHFLTPFTKINSKWMKDLNLRQETIKTLEEKAGKNLFDLGHRNFLLNISPGTRETKAKMNYWDLIQTKTSAQ